MAWTRRTTFGAWCIFTSAMVVFVVWLSTIGRASGKDAWLPLALILVSFVGLVASAVRVAKPPASKRVTLGLQWLGGMCMFLSGILQGTRLEYRLLYSLAVMAIGLVLIALPAANIESPTQRRMGLATHQVETEAAKP